MLWLSSEGKYSTTTLRFPDWLPTIIARIATKLIGIRTQRRGRTRTKTAASGRKTSMLLVLIDDAQFVTHAKKTTTSVHSGKNTKITPRFLCRRRTSGGVRGRPTFSGEQLSCVCVRGPRQCYWHLDRFAKLEK